VVEQGEHRQVVRRLRGEERLETGVAGALVVQSRGADQLTACARNRRRGQVVRHQVESEDLVGVHPGMPGDITEERPRSAADAPDCVHVPLRIKRHRLAVLGQVNGELRHPQDRLVDADQPILHFVGRAHRQPAADPEVAIEP
jgi:hypothetical protein